jgi:hypothetical protein
VRDTDAERSARIIARAAETLRRIDEQLAARKHDGRPKRSYGKRAVAARRDPAEPAA